MRVSYCFPLLLLVSVSFVLTNAFSVLDSASFLGAVHTYVPQKAEFYGYVQSAIEYEIDLLTKNPRSADFVACTNQIFGASIAGQLKDLSLDSVQTIFTSTSQDKVCFLFHSDLHSVEHLPPFVKIAPFPHSLKFSPANFEFSDHEILERLIRGQRVPKVVPNGHFSLSKHLLHPESAISVYIHASEMNSHVHQEIVRTAFTKLLAAEKALEVQESFFWTKQEPQSDSKIGQSWLSYFSKMSLMHSKNDKCRVSDLKLEFVRNSHFIIDGVRTMHDSKGQYTTCIMNLFAHLSMDPRVTYIAFRPKHKVRNGAAQWITQSGVPNHTPVYANGLTGLGEVVGVSDTGLDERNCYFFDVEKGDVVPRSNNYTDATYDLSRRKVIQYVAYVDEFDYENGHGSHVSGSIVGSVYNSFTGTVNLTSETRTSTKVVDNFSPFINNGIAHEAKIAFFDIGNASGSLRVPSDIAKELFPPAYEAGARVHSNSWGDTVNTYMFDDLYIDQFTFNYTDMLILFAAGNSGDEGYNTVGSPAVSKNALSVGASESGPTRYTDNIDYMAFFSSRGPTYDDRIKPDVSAPGYFVESAQSHGYQTDQYCGMLLMAGTSMATPVTAGNAALVRQFFNAGFYADLINAAADNAPISCDIYACDSFNPSGALVKAMLVNSAVGMALYPTATDGITLGPPPDNLQGFGRIKLDNVIANASSATTLLFAHQGSISAGQTLSFEYSVIDITADIHVTLVWMDPPNSVTASKQVLNNLDLVVQTPTGVQYANSGSAKDELNNVEKISIRNSSVSIADTLSIEVSVDFLYHVTSQPFALVVTGVGIVTDIETTTNSAITPTGQCENSIESLLNDFCTTYSSHCEDLFCTTCTYAHYCDLTCGLCSETSTIHEESQFKSRWNIHSLFNYVKNIVKYIF